MMRLIAFLGALLCATNGFATSFEPQVWSAEAIAKFRVDTNDDVLGVAHTDTLSLLMTRRFLVGVDLQTKTKKFVFELDTESTQLHHLQSIAISPDQQHIALGTSACKVFVIESSTGKLIYKSNVKGPFDNTFGMCREAQIWFSDESTILASSPDGFFAIDASGTRPELNTAPVLAIGTYEQHLLYNREQSTLIISKTRDPADGVDVYDMKTKSLRMQLDMKDCQNCAYFALNPSATEFAALGAASGKTKIFVWDLKTGNLVSTLEDSIRSQYSIGYLSDTEVLLTEELDFDDQEHTSGKIRIYDTKSKQKLADLQLPGKLQVFFSVKDPKTFYAVSRFQETYLQKWQVK